MDFQLHSFPTSSQSPNLTLTGTLSRPNNQLTLQYNLSGPDLPHLNLAIPTDAPTRQDNLWETTCFEFFLAPAMTEEHREAEHYWEFNLSPAGHWNCYALSGYRAGLRPEAAFTALPFTVQSSPEAITIALALPLDGIVAASQSIDVSITTVIQTLDESVSYWAIAHTGPEADFHRRDSFILSL
jgi:hypothetical protein